MTTPASGAHSKAPVWIAVSIAAAAFVFQLSLQYAMQPYAINGMYFQEWTSEIMMQTVSLEDLRTAPWETLWHIHIQPPGFDALRALFAHLWPGEDAHTTLVQVDWLLYKVWAVLYAALGALIFMWVSRSTRVSVGIAAAVIFLLHPAGLFYVTLLDTTLLTSVLILGLYFTLWKVHARQRVSIAVLVFWVLTLFFTRSFFHLPFVLVLGLSLLLLGMPARKTVLVVAISASIMLLYGIKQYSQFGTFSTSSFAGFNLNRSVHHSGPLLNYFEYLDTGDFASLKQVMPGLPEVLSRTKKPDGSPNFNHIAYLQFNRYLVEEYRKYLQDTPITHLLRAYLDNLRLYLKPSSDYGAHEIVDRLPWRGFYDKLFSWPVLVSALALCAVAWFIRMLRRKTYLADIGLLLPGLYIFAVTVLFEMGENMRFKFFLEPVLFVFLVIQVYAISKWLYSKIFSAPRRLRSGA